MSKFFDAVRRATEQAGANASPLIPDLSPILARVAQPPAKPRTPFQGGPRSSFCRVTAWPERAVRRSPARPRGPPSWSPYEEHDHKAAEQYRMIRTKIVHSIRSGRGCWPFEQWLRRRKDGDRDQRRGRAFVKGKIRGSAGGCRFQKVEAGPDAGN